MPEDAARLFDTGGLAVGSRANILEFLRSRPGFYYTYLLRRPDQRPFYVGKGRAFRCMAHEQESNNESLRSLKLSVIRKIKQEAKELIYEIDAFHETEDLAHERERVLIRMIGRVDLKTGPLCNLTDGGEGASNWGEETRRKHLHTLGGTENDGTDRSAANRFLARFADVPSKTIKPITAFRPVAIRPRTDRRHPTPRQAASLAASAVANGIPLEPGCKIPRLLIVDGVTCAIENGVCGSLVGAGLATIVPGSVAGAELLQLDAKGVDFVISAVGEEALREGGVIP